MSTSDEIITDQDCLKREIRELERCNQQAMDNAAEYLAFIRMKDLENEFCMFQEALVEYERLKKLFNEKLDD